VHRRARADSELGVEQREGLGDRHDLRVRREERSRPGHGDRDASGDGPRSSRSGAIRRAPPPSHRAALRRCGASRPNPPRPSEARCGRRARTTLSPTARPLPPAPAPFSQGSACLALRTRASTRYGRIDFHFWTRSKRWPVGGQIRRCVRNLPSRARRAHARCRSRCRASRPRRGDASAWLVAVGDRVDKGSLIAEPRPTRRRWSSGAGRGQIEALVGRDRGPEARRIARPDRATAPWWRRGDPAIEKPESEASLRCGGAGPPAATPR
jgi:hypothetical protein